jgi:hypothetical protein
MEAMRAFLVRPVLTGLLALIIAGLWTHDSAQPLFGHSTVSIASCHTTTPGAMIRRAGHC